MKRRGLVRKVKTKSRLKRFGLAGRLKVRVQYEIVVFVQTNGHAFGLDVGRRAWLPEQKMTIGVKALGFDGQLHAPET